MSTAGGVAPGRAGRHRLENVPPDAAARGVASARLRRCTQVADAGLADVRSERRRGWGKQRVSALAKISRRAWPCQCLWMPSLGGVGRPKSPADRPRGLALGQSFPHLRVAFRLPRPHAAPGRPAPRCPWSARLPAGPLPAWPPVRPMSRVRVSCHRSLCRSARRTGLRLITKEPAPESCWMTTRAGRGPRSRGPGSRRMGHGRTRSCGSPRSGQRSEQQRAAVPGRRALETWVKTVERSRDGSRRSDRRKVGAAAAAAAAGSGDGPAAGRPAAGLRRDLVTGANRLTMAGCARAVRALAQTRPRCCGAGRSMAPGPWS